jgi:DNA-binding phage protein
MKRQTKKKAIKWSDLKNEILRDPKTAEAYLHLTYKNDEQLLAALRSVAEAQGVAKVAARARLPRESVSRMLSKRGNPTLANLMALLRGMKLMIRIEEMA